MVRAALPLVLVATLLLGGCRWFTFPDEEANGVQLPDGFAVSLSIDEGAFQPGSVVAVRVENRSQWTLLWTFNCWSSIQRRDGGEWAFVYDEFVCSVPAPEPTTALGSPHLTVLPIEVPAGASVGIPVALPAQAQPGVHRVKLRFRTASGSRGSSTSATTRAFDVEEAAAP